MNYLPLRQNILASLLPNSFIIILILEDDMTPFKKLFDTDDIYIKKTEKTWAFLAGRYGQKDYVIFETLEEVLCEVQF
jgi:hypothetical protein